MFMFERPIMLLLYKRAVSVAQPTIDDMALDVSSLGEAVDIIMQEEVGL